tara:strand:+ start:421 stop:999 length:579 start_codon:yes stop_codon:yes gene_type:complete
LEIAAAYLCLVNNKIMNNTVIIDLEATCCNKGSFPREEMEIIEIGAVSISNDTKEIVSEFQAFIKPERHPILTDFCTELTSITQKDVDAAEGFVSVAESLKKWIMDQDVRNFCSWGFYDQTQFSRDYKYHNMDYIFSNGHRNIKIEFAEKKGLKRGVGLGKALKMLGMEFHGTAHRGIDDARNMARIYKSIL